VARDPQRSTLLRLSDVVAARRWRSSALHSVTGLADQLWLPLSVRGGAVQVVTLGRYGRPFTDRQRDVLLACRAHLVAALGRARRGPHHRALQIRPRLTVVPALDAPGFRAQGTWASRLSDREREVLALVAAGRTDAQVARTLGLTSATVSKHLQRIYRRLDLPNRVAAVRYWEVETRLGSRPVSSVGVTNR
jgi:DNA-binding CsgD family transcriptional regulator